MVSIFNESALLTSRSPSVPVRLNALENKTLPIIPAVKKAVLVDVI